MKISKLLATRQALLRQTQLANLAYAFVTLQRVAARIENVRLRGLVRLRPADPSEERFWATLTALEGNQSVLDEHFADHELIELADAISYVGEGEFDEVDFYLEDVAEKFLAPVRQMLEHSGVAFDLSAIEPNVTTDNGLID